jgi:hypothetical protein
LKTLKAVLQQIQLEEWTLSLVRTEPQRFPRLAVLSDAQVLFLLRQKARGIEEGSGAAAPFSEAEIQETIEILKTLDANGEAG